MKITFWFVKSNGSEIMAFELGYFMYKYVQTFGGLRLSATTTHSSDGRPSSGLRRPHIRQSLRMASVKYSMARRCEQDSMSPSTANRERERESEIGRNQSEEILPVVQGSPLTGRAARSPNELTGGNFGTKQPGCTVPPLR